MKRIWGSIVFICMLAIPGCGEVRREDFTKMQRKDGIAYIANEKSPYTGVLFEEYPSGQRKGEGNFKNGKPHGNIKEWFANGQLKWEANFMDGKPYGIAKEWHANGQLKSEEDFKDGEPIK